MDQNRFALCKSETKKQLWKHFFVAELWNYVVKNKKQKLNWFLAAFFVPSSIDIDKLIVKPYQVINVLTHKVPQREYQYDIPKIHPWLLSLNTEARLRAHKALWLVKTWPKPSQTPNQLQLIMSCPSNGGEFGELCAELSICVGHCWVSYSKFLRL